MAAPRTRKMVAVTFQTAAATKSVTLGPTEGNLSISGLEAGDVAAVQVMNRGQHYALVEGNDKAVTFTITVIHDTTLTNAASRVMDAIRGTGNYSGETSADAAAVVWTGNVLAVVTRGAEVDTITLKNCRLVCDYAEAEGGNTLTINGTAYGLGASGRPVTIAST